MFFGASFSSCFHTHARAVWALGKDMKIQNSEIDDDETNILFPSTRRDIIIIYFRARRTTSRHRHRRRRAPHHHRTANPPVRPISNKSANRTVRPRTPYAFNIIIIVIIVIIVRRAASVRACAFAARTRVCVRTCGRDRSCWLARACVCVPLPVGIIVIIIAVVAAVRT